MTPAHPTAEALTRRAFAGVSAYVIVWQGQPVGRVAFREDDGYLRCLLTVAGQEVGDYWDRPADPYAETYAVQTASTWLRAPAVPDYETDGAHVSRVGLALYDIVAGETWQAALRSAGYDVWQAL